MENENKKIFNNIARNYNNKWVDNKTEEKRIEKIVSYFGLKKGMTIMEPGCGKGDFTPFILKKIGKEGFIYLVDISDEMLKYARKKVGKYKNIKFINSCASEIPIKEKSIDAVIAFNSFPHFYPKQRFVKEFYRVLKEKGFLIIAHDIPKKEINNIHKKAKFNMNKNSLPSRKEMFKILKKQGFVVEKYINKGYYLLKAVKSN
ncbi:MAG: methyltransferase domain-containing protein [Candidatus Goldbacteria bacterium]|nr:methyltransferase domain-containing protein [Candidatus Goldiibacteriota bacterium]